MNMSREHFLRMALVCSCINMFGPVESASWYDRWFSAPPDYSSLEACTNEWIPRDNYGVAGRFTVEVFGQHLVEDGLLRSLHSLKMYGSDRPLVFSFHGGSGVGKSFASKLVVNGWFKRGMDSKYVHVKIGSKDYPFKEDMKQYKKDLTKLIRQSASLCAHQIFIFDEVDMFPPGLLDAIVPFLTPNEKIDGVDYRNCIFILISNIGKESINEKTFKHFENGLRRESLTHKDLEIVLTDEVYHSQNAGLSRSQLVSRYFISYYLPFLPLELTHVEKCVIRSLAEKLHKEKFGPDKVEAVLNELFFEGPEDKFSKKGCKNVDEKVNYVLSPTVEELGIRRNEL